MNPLEWIVVIVISCGIGQSLVDIAKAINRLADIIELRPFCIDDGARVYVQFKDGEEASK